MRAVHVQGFSDEHENDVDEDDVEVDETVVVDDDTIVAPVLTVVLDEDVVVSTGFLVGEFVGLSVTGDVSPVHLQRGGLVLHGHQLYHEQSRH